MQDQPAEELDGEDAEEGTDTVYADVTDGWTATGDEGLVVFIEGGGCYAEEAGGEEEQETADAIYV